MDIESKGTLEWIEVSNRAIRATEERGIFVVEQEADGTYRVGYFPTPGPMATWAKGLDSLDAAKVEAERCAEQRGP